MTHYETLGVQHDATPEDIKKAYRKMSSKAHPDKGGNTELMAAVNLANDVLSDAERRQRYDETGDDSQPDTIEQRAMQSLTRFFDMVLEIDGNLIQMVRDNMRTGEDNARDEIKTLNRKVTRLTKRRDKIKVKSGMNLVHMLIDSQVEAAKKRITALEDAVAVNQIAKKLLDEYVSDEPEPSIRERPPGDDFLMSVIAGMGRGSPFYGGFKP